MARCRKKIIGNGCEQKLRQTPDLLKRNHKEVKGTKRKKNRAKAHNERRKHTLLKNCSRKQPGVYTGDFLMA